MANTVLNLKVDIEMIAVFPKVYAIVVHNNKTSNLSYNAAVIVALQLLSYVYIVQFGIMDRLNFTL